MLKPYYPAKNTIEYRAFNNLVNFVLYKERIINIRNPALLERRAMTKEKSGFSTADLNLFPLREIPLIFVQDSANINRVIEKWMSGI